MPLARQDLELSLAGGLAQQVDERVLAPGKWSTVDNLVPDRQGALTKRKGYGLIPRGVYGLDAIADVVDVIDSRGDEILVYGRQDHETRVWSWSPTLDLWVDKDDVSPCSAVVAPVASAYSGTLLPRVSVTTGGARAWSWQYQRGAITFNLISRVEEASGTVRQDETDFYASTNYLISDQVAVDDSIVTLWRDQAIGTVDYRITDTLTGAIGPQLTLVPGVIYRFAACEYDATTFLVAIVSSTFPGDIVVVQYDLAGAVVSTFTHTVSLSVQAVAIHAWPGVGAVIAWWDLAGTQVGSMGLNDLTWTTKWGPFVEVGPIANVSGLGVAIDENGDATIAATTQTVPFDTSTTTTSTRDNAGAQTSTTARFNIALEAQPFRYDGAGFVVVTQVQAEPTQPRYGATMLVAVDGDDAPSVVATVLRTGIGGAGTAALFEVGGTLARIPALDAFRWLIPMSAQQGSTLSSDVAQNVTLASCTLDFTQRQSALRWGAEQRDCLAHSGGFASWYDGTAVVEQGFVAAPNIRAATPNPIGGLMAPGTYLYQVAWEWYDERGNLHQSEPSLPVSVTIAAGPSTGSVELDVDTLSLTRKGDSADGVFKRATLAVFRTLAGGDQVFYRLTPRRAPLTQAIVNTPAAAFVGYVDTHNDADLNGPNPLALGFIYTSGGILPNEFPPAPTAIVSTKNRLWIGAGREVWFSKLIVQGEGPAWSSEFVLTLDDANDPITALADLDDKVIVFTRQRAYYITGEGPNDANGGGGFQGPFRIPIDDGCSDQRSCVTYPEGVLYWDGTAIQQMSRALQIEPKGDPVLDVTSNATGVIGKLDPPTQRVYMLCERPALLGFSQSKFAILDYRFGQWVTQTNYGTVSGDPPHDAAVGVVGHHWHNGQHWIAIGDDPSNVGRTDYGATPGLDCNVWFPATLTTPWLHVAGVNGYQRCWDVTVTGKRLSPHFLTVEVLTDYDDTTVRQQMVTDVDSLSPMLGLPVERLSLHMRAQLCSAVRVRLYDSQPLESIPTQDPTGWDVAGVTIGIGVKPGNARLPARNKGG